MVVSNVSSKLRDDGAAYARFGFIVYYGVSAEAPLRKTSGPVGKLSGVGAQKYFGGMQAVGGFLGSPLSEGVDFFNGDSSVPGGSGAL